MSALTQTIRGRSLLVAMVVMMIAAIVFLGPPGNAEVTDVRDGGVILLSTGPEAADNWVRHYPNPSTPLNLVEDDYTSQSISLNRCAYSSDDSILEITVTGASRGVGLVNNGFGTRDKNNCSTDGGQVEFGDTIKFALGNSFDSTYAIVAAELDIEGKQNAELEWELSDGYTDYNPLNRAASDNGPDSGVNDNEIVRITPSPSTSEGFTSVTLRPIGNPKALISVEGGGDGDVAGGDGDERGTYEVNQSLFSLTSTRVWDGDLNCGQDRGPAASEANAPADGGLIERYAENGKAVDCEPVAYDFRLIADEGTDPGYVYFDFADDGQGARFLVRIDWDPAYETVNPVAPPVRQVDYGGGSFVPGVACSLVDEGSIIDYLPDDDDIYTIPGDLPTCLAGQAIVLEGSTWRQIQWWFVEGDPKWR